MEHPFYQDLQARQRKLLDSLGSDVLILPAGAAGPHDVARFAQNNDFYYMTGFPEGGAVAVFDPSHDTEQVTLFVKENNHYEQVWNGFTMGVEKAAELIPADKVYLIDDLESVLAKRLKERRVYYKANAHHPSSELIQDILKGMNVSLLEKDGPFDTILEMRAFKSPAELAQMRQAIQITGEAFHACMKAGTRHAHEYQIEAEFEYACKMQGVLRYAFGTIVAAGAHATCQHYVDNAGPVHDGDLVLLDAGAIWNHYCADITRTFPKSGKFTKIQRDLYEAVLASQKAGVEMVKPGVRLFDVHRHSAVILVDALKDLSLVKGDTEEIVEKAAYKDFWPGSLCHSLGLDVHDALPAEFMGPDATRALEPGMVITVEPGFYSQDFNHQIPEEYRQIGIRIEDDLVVTEDGHENLSVNVVKEADDVEALVQSGQ